MFCPNYICYRMWWKPVGVGWISSYFVYLHISFAKVFLRKKEKIHWHNFIGKAIQVLPNYLHCTRLFAVTNISTFMWNKKTLEYWRLLEKPEIGSAAVLQCAVPVCCVEWSRTSGSSISDLTYGDKMQEEEMTEWPGLGVKLCNLEEAQIRARLKSDSRVSLDMIWSMGKPRICWRRCIAKKPAWGGSIERNCILRSRAEKSESCLLAWLCVSTHEPALNINLKKEDKEKLKGNDW